MDAAKAAGLPMTFAMTFPPGTHAMWIRYWLAAGGIDPDKEWVGLENYVRVFTDPAVLGALGNTAL